MAGVLQALLRPATVSQFVEDFWPERPAVIPASLERVRELFPLLASVPVRRLVEGYPQPVHAVGSNNTDGSQERMTDGRAAAAALDAGRTLCLAGVHMVSAEAHNAIANLTTELGLPMSAAQCNGYTSPPGEGVPWHFDDREVIVVQLQGSKWWTVAVNREVRYPTSNFVLATRRPDEGDAMSSYSPREFAGPSLDDQHELLLEPGSVIFLPRGTWHMTYASEPSFSLSFGFFLPTALDVLLDAVRRRYVVDERYRRPLNHASPAQREQAMAWLVELLRDWQQDMSRYDSRDLLQPGKVTPRQPSRTASKETPMPAPAPEAAQTTPPEAARAAAKKATMRTRATPPTASPAKKAATQRKPRRATE